MNVGSKAEPKGYVGTKKADMIPDVFQVKKVTNTGWELGTLNGEPGWAKISIGSNILGIGNMPNRLYGKAHGQIEPTTSAKAGAE